MANVNMAPDTTKPNTAQPKPDTSAPRHAEVKVDVVIPTTLADTSKP
jgi:hypothetical protein